ncbi:Hint domain-containing protein [Albidovulum sp.]
MSHMQAGYMIDQAADAAPAGATGGIAAGTVILTLEGALPVEFLEPGDRIITREGMRVLRAVRVGRYSGPAIRVRAGALGHDRPEQDLVLAADTPVLIRDWRAQALFGAAQAVVPVSRLAEGEFIAPTRALSMRVHQLYFDRPQVVYAEGLEIACAALTHDVATAG